MHLTDSEIRSYEDNELTPKIYAQARAHLAACPDCRLRKETLTSRAETISEQLKFLSLMPDEKVTPGKQAFTRFENQYLSKEKKTMFERIFARQYRLAWVAFGVLAILGLALLFPPVQAVANSFLGLFRVEQIAVVQVNPGNLPEQLGSSSQFEYLIANDVEVQDIGVPEVVPDASEASRLAGIPVRLPSQIEGERELTVQPGTKVSLRVDLPKIRTLLQEFDMGDIELPEQLDGALVTMELPRAVTAGYGDCDFSSEAAREAGFDPDGSIPRQVNCTTFVQMKSPAINAPPGLDIAGLGKAFLIAMGMTPEEAESFSQNVDWTTTLVLPIPRYGTEHREVSVDGVTGTLIQQSLDDHAPQYMLVWVKNDVLYALAGSGEVDTALEIAGSLQ
jgi:hypothetical protein